MSTNLPEQQPSEEIDLGQLFKLIGNAFERFFKFIGSIFNKLFLAFVWFVFFTKKHLIKIIIAAVIGILLGIVKERTGAPVYKSTIVIQQNFNTGEHLFNTIEYYNSLIVQKDSVEVSNIFKITPEQAGKIVELEMESNLNENQKLQLFNEYIKTLDSTLASTVKYKEFLKNTKDYNYSIQKLTLKSSSKNNFSDVLTTIIKNIDSSDFFRNERQKRIDNLNNTDTIIDQALKDSKALQTVYKEVLKEPLEELPSGTSTSVVVGGANDKKVTREFELFSKDIELKRELVANMASREDLKEIIEIVSIQDGDGVLDNKAKLFGLETSWMVSLAIKIALLFYLILLLIEFVNFLDRFKDKVG